MISLRSLGGQIDARAVEEIGCDRDIARLGQAAAHVLDPFVDAEHLVDDEDDGWVPLAEGRATNAGSGFSAPLGMDRPVDDEAVRRRGDRCGIGREGGDRITREQQARRRAARDVEILGLGSVGTRQVEHIYPLRRAV
jgi:hypothetical protein